MITWIGISLNLGSHNFRTAAGSISKTMYLSLVGAREETAVNNTQAVGFAVHGGGPDGLAVTGVDSRNFILASEEKRVTRHNHRVGILARNGPPVAIFHLLRQLVHPGCESARLLLQLLYFGRS